MYNDVIDLRDFYNSPMGRTVQGVGRRHMRAIWPTVKGMNLAGIGYPTPYLRPFLGEAERVVALMPAEQGAVHWPTNTENDELNIVSLVPEDDLPLGDLSMDRILLVHAIECSEQSHKLLREIWRVMAGGGRLLIVVPNRRGIWARLDHTPFGHGHPYTPRQISRLLRDNLFQPEQSNAGLFVPPTRSRVALASARAIEQIGFRWFRTVGGLLFIEAQKQIYAGTTSTAAPKGTRPYIPIVGGTKRSSMRTNKFESFAIQ